MKTRSVIRPLQHIKNTPVLIGRPAKEPRIPKRSLSTLQRIGKLCLECLPMEFGTSDLWPGRIAFAPIPLKRHPSGCSHFLHIYAEARLPKSPSRPEIGFTEDEVIETLGVIFFRPNCCCEYGESFPLEWLLNQLDDLSLRQRILHRAVDMMDLIRLDEQYIDEQNALLASREFALSSLH